MWVYTFYFFFFLRTLLTRYPKYPNVPKCRSEGICESGSRFFCYPLGTLGTRSYPWTLLAWWTALIRTWVAWLSRYP